MTLFGLNPLEIAAKLKTWKTWVNWMVVCGDLVDLECNVSRVELLDQFTVKIAPSGARAWKHQQRESCPTLLVGPHQWVYRNHYSRDMAALDVFYDKYGIVTLC